MKFVRRRTYFKQIESTALTDIVFLLLIFFMLTSSFVTHTGIKIALPGVNKPVENKLKKDISVSLTKKGEVFVNDKIIPKESLEKELRAILEKDEEKVVVFRPDKQIQVEMLIEAMDVANVAGASRLVIATTTKEDK